MLYIFRVEGDSMLPTLTAGDYVIASRLFFKPRKNQLVVVDHPVYSRIVKRITEVCDKRGFYLSGENTSSVSSEKMGWIHKSQILARVLFSIKKPKS